MKNKIITVIACALLFSGCTKKTEVELTPKQVTESIKQSPFTGLTARACEYAKLYKGPTFGSEIVLDDNGEQLNIECGTELLILDFVTKEMDLTNYGEEIWPFAFVEVKETGMRNWIPLELIAFDIKVCDTVFDDIKPVWNYVKDFNIYIPGKLTQEDADYLNEFTKRLITKANVENNSGLNYMIYRFLLRQYRIVLDKETKNSIKINPLEIIPFLYKKDFTNDNKFHNASNIEWQNNELVNAIGADFTLDADGKTPLMEAVLNENTDAIDYLLKQHADKNKTDSEGISALQMAKESKNPLVIKHMMNSFELSDYDALIKEITAFDSEICHDDSDSDKIIYTQNDIPLKEDYSIWLNRVIKNCELITVTGERVSLSPSEPLTILEKFDDKYKKIIDDTYYSYYLVTSLNSEINSTGILSGDCISNSAITFSHGAVNTEKFYNIIIKHYKQNTETNYYEFYDLKTGNKKKFLDSTGEHTLYIRSKFKFFQGI